MAGASMPSYRRNGLRLHYGVEGSGEPVLLAHGMSGSGRADWARLVDVLASRYRCIVPDLRGHGSSEFAAAGFGYRAIRDDLVALVEHEQLEQVHLVGFSMGAECVLDVELSYPGTAASLVLIGPCTGRPADQPRVPAGQIRAPDHWPAELRLPHEARHGTQHWRTLVRLVSADWQHRPEVPPSRLARLACPVLLVVGHGELAFKRRQARIVAATAPEARLVEVPGDHPVHLQEPDLVNETIVGFLDEVNAGRHRP
jgi:3-oxoadipate enol-lactonase